MSGLILFVTGMLVLGVVVYRVERTERRISREIRCLVGEVGRMIDEVNLACAKERATLQESMATIEEAMATRKESMATRRHLEEKILAVRRLVASENSNGLRRRIAAETAAVVALYSRQGRVDQRPPMSGWSLSAQVLREILLVIDKLPPGTTVVELGSGVSTVWIADAIVDRSLSLVSFEHDEQHFIQTREMLDRLDDPRLEKVVDLRLAPLVPTTVDGSEFVYYSNMDRLDNISLLLVDGPPGATGPLARFPAVPVLSQHMVDGAWVVLDDVSRAEEDEIVNRWQRREWEGRVFEHWKTVDRAAFMRTSLSLSAVSGERIT